MLSKDYARERAKLIDMAKAQDGPEPGRPPGMGTDTTYLCTVDEEGNMVSYIQSNYANFGSGLVAGGTGFVLQNRGELFSLDPKSPNVLAGHKRPLHTIIPAFASKAEVRIAFGIMGGWNQSQAHAQFVSDIVDLPDEYPGGNGSAAICEAQLCGPRCGVGVAVPRAGAGRVDCPGHQIKVAGYYDDTCGAGAGGVARFRCGGQLRRLRPAQGWGGHTAVDGGR